MGIPFFTTQVHFLYWIASLRNVGFDSFFLFLSYFDSPYFLMVLIPAVWIGASPRWGLRLALLLIFSTLVNFHLKSLFQSPRPIVDFPDLAMLPLSDPGFPSGGAQMAALVGGLLIYAWKSPWAWAVAAPYVFFISFSRLYLGVHYPTDVLGGFVIGLAILFAYIYSIPSIDKFCREQGRGFCVIVSASICFLYAYLLPSPPGYRLMGAFLGFCLGAYVSLRFNLYPKMPRSLLKRIASASLAILTVFLIYLLTPSYTPPAIQAFALALWISLGAFPFYRFCTTK